MSYKTKFSNGDFRNKSMLELVPNRGINPSVGASIYKFGLSVSVCLFVSNKRQNGWTDRAQIFCGTSPDHREGLWMIKIQKNVF